MSYRVTALSVFILLSILVHGAGVAQQEQEPPADKVFRQGESLYRTYCSLCHGEDGEGYIADEANALSNQDFLRSASDAFIIEGIAQGRPGTPMSAWGSKYGGVLGDDEILALLAFIRGWQTEKPANLSGITVDGDAKRGKKIYKQWCAACHGKQGEGLYALSLSNRVFQETASDPFIYYAIKEGRRETSMPAFKARLLTQEVYDVIAFIRTMEPAAKQVPIGSDVKVEFTPARLEGALLNPGNPLAEFVPAEGRYVPADSVYAAYKANKSFIIIDARPHNDYLRAHIEGAVSVPFYDVGKAVDLLPRDAWIITYCVCPHAMSGKALDKLRSAGFEKTGILDEGFNVWMDRGYPVGKK
jgi:cytochrome c oxidase cbb3-type subunit 3/ubiquinol-cytochrome c reductase cytochrome c subunit